MFDIGFSEIVVIGVVALIVIGPERLPKVARTLGHMFGRLQRYVNEVKADINREIELDELRKLQSQVQSAARDIEQSVTQTARDMESGVRSVESQLNEAAAATSSPEEPPPQPSPPGGGSKTNVPAADSTATDTSRQATLPGFERI
jgi:sec-independent protein translocase protein TatB